MIEPGEVVYYGSAHKLDAMIADPNVSIHDVIREVEHMCTREAMSSKNYRENPPAYMAHSWHPWWSFVITGNAGYLGWEVDEVPPDARQTAWNEAYR